MKVWVCEEGIDYEGIYGYSLYRKKEKAEEELRGKIINVVKGSIQVDRNYRTDHGDIRIFEREIQ